MAKCPICGGTGDTTNNIPPTNEQWFCSLSTEEKAKFLGEKVWVENNRLDYLHRAEAWERWLKQPHTTKE